MQDKKFVRIIDSNGLFVGEDFVEELTDLTIEVPCPVGFILPKWDGTRWIEGGVAPTPSVEEQIKALKSRLYATDYKAIKYAEGWISEADYAEIKAERQAFRDQINELESSL